MTPALKLTSERGKRAQIGHTVHPKSQLCEISQPYAPGPRAAAPWSPAGSAPILTPASPHNTTQQRTAISRLRPKLPPNGPYPSHLMPTPSHLAAHPPRPTALKLPPCHHCRSHPYAQRLPPPPYQPHHRLATATPASPTRTTATASARPAPAATWTGTWAAPVCLTWRGGGRGAGRPPWPGGAGGRRGRWGCKYQTN